MKHLFRSVAGLALHCLLATAFYRWARAILHGLASGRLMHARSQPIMLGAAFALAALMWVLHCRYHFVRRFAHFMPGLAFIRTLLYPHRTGLAAIARCPLLVLLARGRCRPTDRLTPTRGADVPDAARDSYFQAVHPRTASTMQPSQPAMPASSPDPVAVVEPAYSFDDLVRQPQYSFLATNSIAALDTASILEGRIDFKVEVPPPDLEARKAILRRSVGEAMGFHPLAAPMLASLAKRWEGFSAARLASLGSELAVMRHEGVIGEGSPTFEVAMQAMRRLQGSKGRVPENVKSIDEIVLPDVSRLGLYNLAFRLRHIHNFERLGGSVPRGVLFYGPPGTGKTLSAMSLAKASGYAFLKTTGAELLANPSTWDRLVRDAKDLRPAIVFISGAEDVLGDRRKSGSASLTNRLLATLDGAEGRVCDILYICATNSPAALDPAVLRGGRLQEAIAFPVPTHADLAAYVRPRLKVMAGDVFAISRHTIDCAVAGLKGRSIGDADAVMQRIIDAAALRHLREGTAVITAEDVSAALRGTTWSY
jgi:ATP-dependent 26S proteasome regulatory subunit